MRVGMGYDVHRIETGRPLVLGGVRFPSDWGLAGHSDADVLCHAIGDALLGAAGLGDLGTHFPPGDPQWKDASSLTLLTRIAALAISRDWQPLAAQSTAPDFAKDVAPVLYRNCVNCHREGGIGPFSMPKTPKSAKYAGNWDPKSKKPWSYQLQQWILSNTFLTKNMKVLVYGVWDGQSQNIYPFFKLTRFLSPVGYEICPIW